MDILKQEMMKKRQSLAENVGGRKVFKRSEIEQKRIQKIREEEKREMEAKALKHQRQQPDQRNGSNSDSSSNPNSKIETANSKADSAGASSSKTLADEQKIDDLNLPKQDVIRRLRLLKHPTTLFGEDDEARLNRLKYVLKNGLFEVDDSDMTEGQTNDFLRDIVELKKRQKSGISTDRKRKATEDRSEDKEIDGGDGNLSGDAGSSGAECDNDSKRMKANFDELCDLDKILVFFKRLLNEWKQELDEMNEIEKRTAKGKSIVATFKQCARYLHPLFKFCRKKVLPDDIRRALIVVVKCCMKRDYLAAMDQYIKMAIGNAPWPIGVTMVGIHERSAREKIYTNSVAHIMNDETTRKYLQSVKRLMTFCQRKYPALPSKAVEFNSLANGSDLQALLAEETSSHGSEETLELNRELNIPEAVPTPVVEEPSSEEQEAGARALPVAPTFSAQPQSQPQPQSPEIEMSLSVADVSHHAVPITTDFGAVLSSIQFLTDKVHKLEDRARRSEEFEDKMTALSARHAKSLETRDRKSAEFEDKITAISARQAESLASIEFLMWRHFQGISQRIVSSGEKTFEGVNALGAQIEEIVNYCQEARQRIEERKGEGQASGARAQGSSSGAGRGVVIRPPAARGAGARGRGRSSVFEKLLGDGGSESRQ